MKALRPNEITGGDSSPEPSNRGKASGEYLATKTSAQSIVSTLCALGVDTFFGVPGGPIIAVFDAVLRTPGARLVEPRHETYGVFEAMGSYRANGRTTAIVVTAGPGATNVVTGIAAAHLERVPMILLCGDTAWERTGKRLLQSLGPEGLGFEDMLRGMTRARIRLTRGGSTAAYLRAAVDAAENPTNPGPVLVVAPLDLLDAAEAALDMPAQRAARPLPQTPHPAVVTRAAEALRGAARPLVVIGAGCRTAVASVTAMVDAIGAPFMTTPQAKGLIDEDHPLSLRGCGMSASFWARRYSRAHADVTLVLGTDLDDVSFAGTPPVGPGGTLIHVDLDPRVFGRNHPTFLPVTADLGAFARALAGELREGGPLRDGAALAAAARSVAAYDVPGFASDASVPIAPHRVIADLAAAAPGATFVTDIGEHMLFALHYLTARGPRDFVIHLGLGSMASGIASAIGLAIGDPSRRVVCICGDGGMQMAGMELLLAVKHRLPVVYAVFNDARYNMVYHGHRLTYGREAPWETPQIDFVQWAESIGARGCRIERPGEITQALLDDLTRGSSPVVLDIRHDRDVRIRGDGRIEALTQMSRADPNDGSSGGGGA